ncbi:hypothetical protein [Telmatospirillum sp. J64-1]|uniref:hypothetical protein n=1 Tax=Telmatospirillum sp. J64-1 TaxID=2502183 RepID=UPI00115CD34D|nr:hypothetical protein [Telmatospirillum sp. J64-1]
MTLRMAIAGGGLAAFLLGMAAALAGSAFWLGLYLALLVGLTAVPLGALALLMIHQLAGGEWGRNLGPLLRGATRLLPLAALLFVPVLVGLEVLYPWARPGWEGPGGKGVWLQDWFFIARSVVYFASWILTAWLLLRPGRHPVVAGLGMAAYTITASLAGVDWLMTLEPEFNSSVFGLLFMSQLVLGALALLVAVALRSPMALPARKTLASLLLAAVLLWGYLAFMQYLVIWSVDLPHEVSWYLQRSEGVWALIPWGLVLLQFLLPLILLLSWARSSRRILAGVAVLLFAMHMLEAGWMVLPGLRL